MKKEVLSKIINEIDEEYVNEAMEVLYKNQKSISPMEGKHMRVKKLYRVAVVAACCGLVAVTSVYAKGLFQMTHRKAEPDETFSFSWVDVDGEIHEDEWKDAKMVFHFEGMEKSSEIEFKEHWLPFAPNEEYDINKMSCSEDGFRTILTSECAAEDNVLSIPQYNISTYYASQFANDGALLLLYMEPDEIVEEQKEEYEIIKFSATNSEQVSTDADEKVNYIMMFNAEKGFLIVIRGSADMEILEHIASELEIRETGQIIKSSDYDHYFEFLDAGRG